MRPSRALVGLAFAFALSVTGGCDKAKDTWSSITKDEPSETSKQDEIEQALELERERAELARLEAERLERERAEARERVEQLEQGDALVASWAERLAGELAPNNAFVAHQGLTEDDPWGKQLRVVYSDPEQDDEDSQTLEVRSAGPNGVFDDDDDLVRTQSTQIERSFWERNKLWIVIGVLWLGAGIISAGGLTRRRHRKKGEPDQGLDLGDILWSLLHIMFAPLSALFWLLLAIIELFTAIAD